MKIVKILNNNAVVCCGQDGTETIAMGRGLAFQQKAGNELDDSKIEKTFVLQTEEKRRRFQKFIQDIPLEDILLAEKIISHAQAQADRPFDDSIYITLTDHLSAALERVRTGITVTNPLTSAIKSFYPREFQMGVDAVETVWQETGVTLSLDETAFFTMHFVTAELGKDSSEFSTVLSFVTEISDIVRADLKNSVDETSITWQRFVTHLSFFAQRILTGKEQTEQEALLYDSVAKSYPKALACVERITARVQERYSYTVGCDEKTYLMIHINRLQQEFGMKDAAQGGGHVD